MKFHEYIYSKKHEDSKTIIRFLGFKISITNLKHKIYNNIDVMKLNRFNQINLSTCLLHLQTFPKFKNIHQGKEIVLVASGVSASKYATLKNIKTGAIHIGVNRSFQINNYIIPMKYIFIQDYSGKTKEYIDDLDKYRPDFCQKFYGLTTEL